MFFRVFGEWGNRNKNYRSSPFSFSNIVLLPILGGSGTHFETTRAKLWGNQCLKMFETIINELSGVENGRIGTKMSILALLVSEIW